MNPTARRVVLPDGSEVSFIQKFARATHSKWGRLASLPATLSQLMPVSSAYLATVVAERRGLDPQAVRNEWNTVAAMSQPVRERLNARLLKLPAPASRTHSERAAEQLGAFFDAADTAAEQVLEHYDVVGTDVLVVDSRFKVASLVDAILRRRTGGDAGRFTVVNTRVSSSGEGDFFLRKFDSACVPPLHFLPNTAHTRAAVRCAVNAHMLVGGGYVPHLLSLKRGGGGGGNPALTPPKDIHSNSSAADAEAQQLNDVAGGPSSTLAEPDSARLPCRAEDMQWGELLLMPGLLTPVAAQFTLFEPRSVLPPADSDALSMLNTPSVASVADSVLAAAAAMHTGVPYDPHQSPSVSDVLSSLVGDAASRREPKSSTAAPKLQEQQPSATQAAAMPLASSGTTSAAAAVPLPASDEKRPSEAGVVERPTRAAVREGAAAGLDQLPPKPVPRPRRTRQPPTDSSDNSEPQPVSATSHPMFELTLPGKARPKAEAVSEVSASPPPTTSDEARRTEQVVQSQHKNEKEDRRRVDGDATATPTTTTAAHQDGEEEGARVEVVRLTLPGKGRQRRPGGDGATATPLSPSPSHSEDEKQLGDDAPLQTPPASPSTVSAQAPSKPPADATTITTELSKGTTSRSSSGNDETTPDSTVTAKASADLDDGHGSTSTMSVAANPRTRGTRKRSKDAAPRDGTGGPIVVPSDVVDQILSEFAGRNRAGEDGGVTATSADPPETYKAQTPSLADDHHDGGLLDLDSLVDSAKLDFSTTVMSTASRRRKASGDEPSDSSSHRNQPQTGQQRGHKASPPAISSRRGGSDSRSRVETAQIPSSSSSRVGSAETFDVEGLNDLLADVVKSPPPTSTTAAQPSRVTAVRRTVSTDGARGGSAAPRERADGQASVGARPQQQQPHDDIKPVDWASLVSSATLPARVTTKPTPAAVATSSPASEDSAGASSTRNAPSRRPTAHIASTVQTHPTTDSTASQPLSSFPQRGSGSTGRRGDDGGSKADHRQKRPSPSPRRVELGKPWLRPDNRPVMTTAPKPDEATPSTHRGKGSKGAAAVTSKPVPAPSDTSLNQMEGAADDSKIRSLEALLKRLSAKKNEQDWDDGAPW